MSRCFPFPPPGYERKITVDNTESLTKENHKEKKDKKKRDKERKVGKERKHKDRSKEKHGEKKTHKEKHRNKKDGDRDKNKDNSRISNDRVLEEWTIYHQVDNYGEVSAKAGPSKDSKSTEALGSKIRERADGNQMVENVANISPAKNAGMGRMVDKERRPGAKMDKPISIEKRIRSMEQTVAEGAINNSSVNNFITPEQRSIDTGGMVEKGRTTDVKIERYLPANGTRIGAVGNVLVERATANNALRFISAEQARHIGTGRVVERERSTDAKMDTDYFANQKRTLVIGNLLEGANGNNVGNSNIIVEQRRDFVTSGVEEGEVDTKIRDANKWIRQEKTKDLEANNKKNVGHRDKDRDKSEGKKDTVKKKEKKKDTDKIREKGEDKEGKIADTGKKEQDASSFKSLFPPQYTSVKCAGFDGNLKRKQINGFLHENDFQPNKLPRTDSFSHLPLENGRKVEMHPIATSCTSEWHAGIGNGVLERSPDERGHKSNGVVKPQPTPTDATTCEVSMKQHPDSRCPSQILSLPKMEEWTEPIDQEWLFSDDDVRRKPSGEATATLSSLVWDKALKIDEADVLAMPYVIPY